MLIHVHNVCKYICKAEPFELTEAISALSADPPFTHLPLRTQKIRIGCTALKSRKLSAQECIYQLSRLKLFSSSRTVMSLNTYVPEKRRKVLRPQRERSHLPHNCTSEHELFLDNILDYYRSRPAVLESTSFHQFAAWYKILPKKIVSHDLTYKLQPPFQDRSIQKRYNFIVIKPTHMRVNSPDYYYTCLLLYKPHRHEHDLLGTCANAEIAFLQDFPTFDSNAIQMHDQANAIDNAVRRLQLSLQHLSSNPIEAYPSIDSGLHADYACLDASSMQQNTTDSTTLGSLDSHTLHSQDLQWHNISTAAPDATSLEQTIQALSADQLQVFKVITSHFNKTNREPLRIFCTGGAGTGKSFLLSTIVEWLTLMQPTVSSRKPVVVAAPTGVAARNVNGYTLHSLFKLPIQRAYEAECHELSPVTLKTLRTFFHGIQTIIIDEISMVSSKMFTYIHHRLCAISNSNSPMGGYNVILFGDFFHLRPVRGQYLFTDIVLWPLFQPCMLTINKRQSGQDRFIMLLNRIRIGHVTPGNMTLLNTRLLAHTCTSFSSHAGLLHIYPTLKDVNAHNNVMQNIVNPIYQVHLAVHTFSSFDRSAGQEVPIDLIPPDDRHAGGLPAALKLSCGTRVMLLRNLCTEQGLVNGAMGLVTNLAMDNDILQKVFVNFDNSTVGLRFQDPSSNNSIPITLYTQEFLHKGRFIDRTTFPLTPCWACTVHKTQGLSLDSAVISLDKTLFQAGQAYVALSRVRSLEGVHITTICPQRIYAAPSVLKEYDRLKSLSQQNSCTSAPH